MSRRDVSSFYKKFDFKNTPCLFDSRLRIKCLLNGSLGVFEFILLWMTNDKFDMTVICVQLRHYQIECFFLYLQYLQWCYEICQRSGIVIDKFEWINDRTNVVRRIELALCQKLTEKRYTCIELFSFSPVVTILYSNVVKRHSYSIGLFQKSCAPPT